MYRSYILFLILGVLFSFTSCQKDNDKSKSKNSGTDTEPLENFEGIVELMAEGTYRACGSKDKIRIVDNSKNAREEYKAIGLPRMQPGYGSFKGYRKTDENGVEYIELLQLYSIKRDIPDECLTEEMPYGIISTMKDTYRLQINPFDNLIRYQDKITEGILDFPFYPFTQEGGYDVFTSSIKTVDVEHNIKIYIKQEECKKEHLPEADFNTSVKIEIDGRSFSSCGSKTL